MLKLRNWNNVTFDERNDLVFAGRNQSYGAYELRTNYNKRIAYIMGGMVLFSLVLMGIKKFADRPKAEEEIKETIKIEQIDLTPPPPVEETPPPPPPPPPPPMVEMVRFVPPVIKDDAVEEEPQKLQEEVKETQVGTKDQEGEEIVAPPTEEAGTGEPAAPEIFTIVEENAEFPGGIAAMGKYIQQNLQYPAMAREAGISGKCFLKFVVNDKGEIGNVEILKGVPGCADCDREAIPRSKINAKMETCKNDGTRGKLLFQFTYQL